VNASKAPVIIRRPVHAKPHPRARLPDDAPSTADTPAPTQPSHDQDTGDETAQAQDSSLPDDELAQIRARLRPPPIPGVDDWGIPPAPMGACDPEIEVCLSVRVLILCLDMCIAD
jgi:hypothetical protein